MPARVPAWQAAVSEDSTGEYVHVLTRAIDGIGWPQTRLVHRLAPVDPDEQEALRAVMPIWFGKGVAAGEVVGPAYGTP